MSTSVIKVIRIVYNIRSSTQSVFFFLAIIIIALVSEDLYVLDELGEVAAFNMRTNPALQTKAWTYSEELGEQAM